VIFAGVGLGIAVSGTLVPPLLQQGLQESWIGLGALSAVMTAISWTNWPREANAAHSAATSRHRHQGRHSNAIRALVLEYGLNACALVPHMVFLRLPSVVPIGRQRRGPGARHRPRDGAEGQPGNAGSEALMRACEIIAFIF
jgi:hypothetical protein